MRILVTGGAGLIGRKLCSRLLGEGHEVVCLDNFSTGSRDHIAHFRDHPRFQFMLADVVDLPYVDVDQVYHLACPASPVHYARSPVRTLEASLLGTRNALQLALRYGARILLASTSEVYGDPTEHPQHESTVGRSSTTSPRACYREGKRAAESLTLAYMKERGVNVRIARIFNSYGSTNVLNDGRVITSFVIAALRGHAITIFGDGRQTRSFCHVDDTVEGLTSLMNSDVTEPVNIGNPEEVSIEQLASTIEQLVGREVDRVHLPAVEDDTSRRCPDITRAKTLLQWEPKVSLVEGLTRVVEYTRLLP